MERISVREATIDDVENFNLRQEDEEEAQASCGISGRDALRLSLEVSHEVWVGELDGEVFCILGCRPHDHGANLWMLFADGLESLPLDFYRKSREHLKTMLDTYGELHSKTRAENVFIVKWLRWLGFDVIEATPLYSFRRTRGK